MKKLYAFLLYLLLTVSAYATDTYYCDTGDDSTGAGTKASPWATWQKAVTTLDGGSAGDNIYLCEGGEFTYYSSAVNTTCTANSPCIITSYQPDDIAPGDVGVQPVIVVATDGVTSGIQISSGAAYITIRDLLFKADEWVKTDTSWGIWLNAETSHITIDDVTFEDVAVGINVTGSLLGDTPHDYLTVKNSRFINNWNVGFIGGATYLRLYDNYFTKNGQNGGGRPIYINGSRDNWDPDYAHDYLASGNVMEYNIPADAGNGAYAGTGDVVNDYHCNLGDVFGGHGANMENLMYKNMVIRESKTTALLVSNGCWGFTFDQGWPDADEDFRNLVFQNDEVYYAGQLGFGCSNCDGVVFRENITYIANTSGVGIRTSNKADEDLTYPTESMFAYYNLVVQDIANSSNPQGGIWGTPEAAISINSNIEWNVIIFSDTDVNNKCTATDSGSTVQNNFCFEVDGSGNFTVSTKYITN